MEEWVVARRENIGIRGEGEGGGGVGSKKQWCE